MDQSARNGSLFNSESEEKDSFSSEIEEKIKEDKNNAENNQNQEVQNNNNNNNINNNNSNFNNQIELKYITEMNRNALYLNLEKIVLNQDSLTNLVKNIFHRI